MQVEEILETCLYVDDLEAAEAFYGDLLGLEYYGRRRGRHVFFRCGRRMLLLFDPGGSEVADSDVPPHGSRGPGHVAFAVRERDLPAWAARLKKAGVPIEQEVAWPQGGRSLYFRDPAGNSLELATPAIWGFEDAPIRQSP